MRQEVVETLVNFAWMLSSPTDKKSGLGNYYEEVVRCSGDKAAIAMGWLQRSLIQGSQNLSTQNQPRKRKRGISNSSTNTRTTGDAFNLEHLPISGQIFYMANFRLWGLKFRQIFHSKRSEKAHGVHRKSNCTIQEDDNGRQVPRWGILVPVHDQSCCRNPILTTNPPFFECKRKNTPKRLQNVWTQQ
jgi:hypothetical protein